MNIPLEFRAWDGKKMYYWNNTDHPAVNQIDGTPEKKLHYLPMSWLVGDSNDWEWMQYTGLKDKNGKKIYRGDLFRGVLGSVRVVAFDDGGFKLVKDRFFKTVAGDMHSLGDMNGLEANNGEVIGNIYESGELLKF